MAVKTNSTIYTSARRSGSATSLLDHDIDPCALVSRHPAVTPASEPDKGYPVDYVPSVDNIIDLTKLKTEEKIHHAVRRLVNALFPGWADRNEHLSLKRISGAMTNAVFFVTNAHGDCLLLRVYGVGCDQLLDRAKELKWLSRLSLVGFGPKLLGKFGNGRFEEYLPSTTLTNADIRSEETMCQIATRLYHLHNIVSKYPPRQGTVLEAWKNIDSWFNTVKHLSSDESTLIWMNSLEKNIACCKRIIKKNNKSPIVFAHNDTQYGNILRLKATQELVVIDFEYAGYNTRGFDIANHFCEWMYNYDCEEPAKMNPDLFPTEEQQRLFLKTYLSEAGSQPEDEATEALRREVSMWIMVSHLVWGLWGRIQASQSEIDFDYLLYSDQRLEAFEVELQKWRELFSLS